MIDLRSSLVACTLSLFLPGAFAQSSVLLTATEEVSNVSQGDWSKRWWQWAASFDQRDSPVSDQTGALCAQKQSGPLWFLAGTYGTRRTIREC